MVATILARRMSSVPNAPRAAASTCFAGGRARRPDGLPSAASPCYRPAMTDAALKRRLEKLQSILDVAKALTAERRLDRLLGLVVDEAAEVAEADRGTIFMADRDKGELWGKVARGTKEIRIPLGAGIAGAVAATGVPIRIDDAY